MTSPSTRVSEPASVLLPRMDLTNPEAFGYGARLGDLWVRLAASPQLPVQIRSRDSLANRVSQLPSNVAENVLDIGFVYSRQDQSGGAGLDWYPRQSRETTDFDETRFFDSANIDVGRRSQLELYGIPLSHPFQEWWDPSPAEPHAIARTNTQFFIGAGNVVSWFSSTATPATPDGSTDIGGKVVSLATIGSTAYALRDNGAIYRKQIGDANFTVWVTPTGATFDTLWSVTDRLIADKTPTSGPTSLVVVVDGATGDQVITTHAPGVYTTDVIDADAIILAATTNDEFLSIGLSSATPPVPEVVSTTPLPQGETVITMGHNLGRLAYVTADTSATSITILRLYTAEVLDARFNFVVGQGEYLTQWEAPGGVFPADISLTSRDEIWILVSGIDEGMALWRYDLKTTGLSRHNHLATAPNTGTDLGGITFGGNRLLLYNNKIYRDDLDDYEQSGYLITPNINNGLNTPINWIAAVLEGSGFETGASLKLFRTTEPDAITDPQHPSWVLITILENATQSGIEIPLSNLTSKSLALKIEWSKSVFGVPVSPVLTKHAIRSIQQHRDLILELPINVSDTVDKVPGRVPVQYPGWGDEWFKATQDLLGTHLDAVVIDPPINFRGVVDAVGQPEEFQTERGSMGVRSVVQLRGARISVASLSSGLAGMGIPRMGVSTMGIDEVRAPTP